MTYYEFHLKVIGSNWQHVNTRGTRRIYEQNMVRASFDYFGNRKIGSETLKRLKKKFRV